MEEYHRRLALAYDKHVQPRVFLEVDLAPKWEGPYIVSEVHSNGHCILLDPDHRTTTGPINFKYVKKYYAYFQL
ncbi:hypothetical protein Ahy_B08g092778 [Arachis hypogaea]|uniref:Uncharacterized protein n=1 Tax=Arachis hypogaea TaxID=3818 RepID=A0A444Y4Q4_ARAHY|nr:hypothetical protein Ahy_B08g092778 [Arachis hypogaea]